MEDPLAPFQVALGVAPSTMPWLDVTKALVARAAGLPKAGGLFGSGYAHFTSQNAPLFLEAAQRRLGLEPPGVRGVVVVGNERRRLAQGRSRKRQSQ